MPFCPKCRYEFVEGIKTCNECGIDLVDELPEEESEEEEYQGEWIKVLNVASNQEAEMIAGLLRTSGIPVTISSYVNDVLTFRYPRGVDILVPEEYSEQAVEVITAFSGTDNNGMVDKTDEIHQQQVEESRVISETAGNKNSKRKAILIAAAILALFILLSRAEGFVELIVSIMSGTK